MTDASELTPTYIARCPECSHIVAAAVAPVAEPIVMRDALKSRREWERQGLVLSTGTVLDVRTATDFGHREDCGRRSKRRRRA